jgi:hypothetical protein
VPGGGAAVAEHDHAGEGGLEVTDRGTLFLFSLGVSLTALGVAGWLIRTGQTAYIDGLFLLLCCLVLVLAFGLYVRYLIRSVIQAAAPPTAAQEKPRPPVRVPAGQSIEEGGERARVFERASRP